MKYINVYIYFIDPVIPMYYYVPEKNIESERQDPGSTYRVPSIIGGGLKSSVQEDASTLYLWNQAMFIISQLLTAGLLHINELDPIRRYLPSYNRPRRAGRYSAFQVIFIIIFK